MKKRNHGAISFLIPGTLAAAFLAAACLPKKDKTDDERSGAKDCSADPGACEQLFTMSCLDAIAGSVSTLDLSKGFSQRETVNFDSADQQIDQVITAGTSNPAEKLRFRRVDSLKAVSGHFLREIVDTDKVLSQNVTMGNTPVAVLRTGKVNLESGDLLMVRGGIAIETRRESSAACGGLVATPQLRTGSGLAPLAGEATRLDAPAIRGTMMMSSLARVATTGEVTFEVAISGNKPTCAATVLEPATMTVMIFSPISRLAAWKTTARFLDRVIDSNQGVNAATKRIATAPSGPPIETLASLDWVHGDEDTALVLASAATTAEDRLAETTSWIQISRAPTAISSHLNAVSLTAGQGAITQNIFDWATTVGQSGTTTFYLVAMGTGENSKPLSIAKPSIRIAHFRRAFPRVGVMTTENSANGSGTSKAGRAVELFEVRARLPGTELPPPEDNLPCRLFRAGPATVPGLPDGVVLPTPAHHHFNTRWQDGKIQFPAVLYENIYHEAPVWVFTRPPDGRASNYAERFYEISVANPASANCSFTARRK